MPKKTTEPRAKSPGEIVTDQIRRHRSRLDISQAELAQRMSDLGIPMHQTTVAKVENGERKVSVDELLLFAVALGVPPGVLLFGIGVEDRVALTPKWVHHPDQAHQWLEGEWNPEPENAHWNEAMRPIQMHQQLRKLERNVHISRRLLARDEFSGDAQRISEGRQDYAEMLLAMADHREEMRSQGVRPPALDEASEWVKSLRLLGREGEV